MTDRIELENRLRNALTVVAPDCQFSTLQVGGGFVKLRIRDKTEKLIAEFLPDGAIVSSELEDKTNSELQDFLLRLTSQDGR